MSASTGDSGWHAVNQWRKQRKIRNLGTLSLVVLGPVLALITFSTISIFEQGAASRSLRFVLLTDLVYVLLVAALVIQTVGRMIAARRAQSAGSRLHLRLTGVFTIIALIPTILVAVFATATLNFGLEGWFSGRVSRVVGNSVEAAQAYEGQIRDGLTSDAVALAGFLDESKRTTPLLQDGDIRSLLAQGQSQIQRGLREAYVIDSAGELKVRGERSYLFDFEKPNLEDIQRAFEGETVVIQDWDNNEFRALLKLNAYVGRYLYVSRNVDGKILNLLDETKETASLYHQLESERGRLLFEFGLIYLGFALIVILAAVWLGLWFAERLSRPVGRLAGAVQRLGAGDFSVRVQEEDGDDEIAMLSRVFNQMTKQMQTQRDALVETNKNTEIRRRLFDSVLTGVTAGVIGLNSKGEIDFMNASALSLLGLVYDQDTSMTLKDAVPEFAGLYDDLISGKARVAQKEIQLTRAGTGENLLVRIATRHTDNGRLEGYVVTFDDVTNLVSAQRMAAWGDVARRIAHEIKNPLTPIQLSAERLKRKFSDVPGVDVEALEQYTDVIVRQTGDLRRIVDEFSKFARMPEPERRVHDIVKLVKDAVVLQEPALNGITISLNTRHKEIWGNIDSTMISQAVINLIKNAGEAVETYVDNGKSKGFKGTIKVDIAIENNITTINIADNGNGLPQNRSRLFEPYVTHRDKGTGLGLSIVKKIIEEHDGTLQLLDAPVFDASGDDKHFGALARIRLPMTAENIQDINNAKNGQKA